MSPRVIPKTPEYIRHVQERHRVQEAALEHAADVEASLDRLSRKHGLTAVRSRAGDGDYGARSVYSWFADQWQVRSAEARKTAAIARGVGRVDASDSAPGVPSRTHGTIHDARARLAAVELRDLSSTATQGGEFLLGAGTPLFIADAFSAAARAQATLADALPSGTLPDEGLKIELPRFTTGASVAVQASENAAVSETDPATATASSNVSYIAGQVDMSRQLFDRAMPGMDVVIAADLGRALGAAVDSALVAGTNANGQTRGLANITGHVAVTYTDASPTAAEIVSKIWEAYAKVSDTATGYGVAAPEDYVVALHPRRHAVIGTSADALRQLEPFGAVVSTGGIRTTLGAGTNEDEIYVVARAESFVALGRPEIATFEEIGSATLTVRISVRQPLAAMFGRAPTSIARISGTGLAAPVW